MLRVHAVDRQAGHIKVLQDTQSNQSGNALAVGRDLVQGIASVVLRDRRDPFVAVIGKVLGGQGAAVLCAEALDGLRNFTAVKGLAFAFGDGAHTPRCGFELKQLTHVGRATPGQKAVGKAGQVVQLGRGGRPFLLHHHRQQIAALGNLNGRLHQIGERQFAKALTQRHPAADRTGHRHRVKTALGWCRHIGAVFAFEIVGRPALGRAA